MKKYMGVPFCRNKKNHLRVFWVVKISPVEKPTEPRLSSLASRSTWFYPEKTGFFVIDPAEDCATMGDVRQLLTTWSSQGQEPGKPVDPGGDFLLLF